MKHADQIILLIQGQTGTCGGLQELIPLSYPVGPQMADSGDWWISGYNTDIHKLTKLKSHG